MYFTPLSSDKLDVEFPVALCSVSKEAVNFLASLYTGVMPFLLYQRLQATSFKAFGQTELEVNFLLAQQSVPGAAKAGNLHEKSHQEQNLGWGGDGGHKHDHFLWKMREQTISHSTAIMEQSGGLHTSKSTSCKDNIGGKNAVFCSCIGHVPIQTLSLLSVFGNWNLEAGEAED